MIAALLYVVFSTVMLANLKLDIQRRHTIKRCHVGKLWAQDVAVCLVLVAIIASEWLLYQGASNSRLGTAFTIAVVVFGGVSMLSGLLSATIADC